MGFLDRFNSTYRKLDKLPVTKIKDIRPGLIKVQGRLKVAEFRRFGTKDELFPTFAPLRSGIATHDMPAQLRLPVITKPINFDGAILITPGLFVDDGTGLAEVRSWDGRRGKLIVKGTVAKKAGKIRAPIPASFPAAPPVGWEFKDFTFASEDIYTGDFVCIMGTAYSDGVRAKFDKRSDCLLANEDGDRIEGVLATSDPCHQWTECMSIGSEDASNPSSRHPFMSISLVGNGGP